VTFDTPAACAISSIVAAWKPREKNAWRAASMIAAYLAGSRGRPARRGSSPAQAV